MSATTDGVHEGLVVEHGRLRDLAIPPVPRIDGVRVGPGAGERDVSLDNNTCQTPILPAVLDVEVIEDPAAAVVALHPVRARLLSELSEPASASALAGRVGLGRQKVNYHLRALEQHGLVRESGTRQWGGLTERLLIATAASYVVSPAALGEAATDPDPRGRPSLRALPRRPRGAGRAGGRRARGAGRPTGNFAATFASDTQVPFRSWPSACGFTEGSLPRPSPGCFPSPRRGRGGRALAPPRRGRAPPPRPRSHGATP